MHLSICVDSVSRQEVQPHKGPGLCHEKVADWWQNEAFFPPRGALSTESAPAGHQHLLTPCRLERVSRLYPPVLWMLNPQKPVDHSANVRWSSSWCRQCLSSPAWRSWERQAPIASASEGSGLKSGSTHGEARPPLGTRQALSGRDQWGCVGGTKMEQRLNPRKCIPGLKLFVLSVLFV